VVTEILNFDELTSAQSNKFVTYNKNLRKLEASSVSVLSRSNGGPPGSPSEGDAYIVDVSSGDWSSFAINSIAHYYLGTWKNYSPNIGWRVTIVDETILGFYNGSIWINLVLASLGENDWLITTGSLTLSAGDRYFADCTSNNITLTLPATSTIGQQIEIADVTLPSGITNEATDFTLTLDNNGSNIEGTNQNITSNLPGKVFKLTYVNAAYGWKLFK